MLLSLTFSYYPALSLLYYSLTDWSGLGWDMNFIGFDNYVEILRSLKCSVHSRTICIIWSGPHPSRVCPLFCRHSDKQAEGEKRLPGRIVPALRAAQRGHGHHVQERISHGVRLLNTPPARLDSNPCESWLGDKGIVNFALAFISMWKYMGLNMVIFIGAAVDTGRSIRGGLD